MPVVACPEAGRVPGAPSTRATRWFLATLLALSLILFAGSASLGLAGDDVGWLHGAPLTAVDAHRVLPRIVFDGLRSLFGPSAPAALATIWLLHALNGLLLYRLARCLLAGREAALAAVAVFLINPLTLGGLTWISCLAYVLATTFGLMALLAAWQVLRGDPRPRPGWPGWPGWPDWPGWPGWPGWIVASLACLGLGLCSNYDLVFLPLAWTVLGGLGGRLRPGLRLGAAGLALALPLGALVWAPHAGPDPWRLLDGQGALAYASFGLSSVLGLALTYPLSFFIPATGLLQACFSEPARWALTALAVAAGVLCWGRRAPWRTGLALGLFSMALLVPYCARLILAPAEGSYHPSYLLSGRLHYLPFTGIALILGHLAGVLVRRLPPGSPAWLLWALPVAATGQALWIYDPGDFVGLTQVAGSAARPEAWAPFARQHPAWLLLPPAAAILALALRRSATRRKEASRVEPLC